MLSFWFLRRREQKTCSPLHCMIKSRRERSFMDVVVDHRSTSSVMIISVRDACATQYAAYCN
jgi:hypothetical protein